MHSSAKGVFSCALILCWWGVDVKLLAKCWWTDADKEWTMQNGSLFYINWWGLGRAKYSLSSVGFLLSWQTTCGSGIRKDKFLQKKQVSKDLKFWLSLFWVFHNLFQQLLIAHFSTCQFYADLDYIIVREVCINVVQIKKNGHRIGANTLLTINEGMIAHKPISNARNFCCNGWIEFHTVEGLKCNRQGRVKPRFIP